MSIGIRNSRGLKRGNARTLGLATAMAVAGLLTLAGPASASLPQGPEMRAGQAAATVVGNTMTIRQISQAAKVDWTSFDIGKDHAVRIEQPNREAFIVNRVTGTTRSQIDGQLSANGQVYLVNPNGVVFGAGAKVDVGGLVAAGVGLGDEQMSGEGEPLLSPMRANGDIEHSGLIVVREGGVARLSGANVVLHEGSRIQATGAEVGLDARHVQMAEGSAIHAFGGRVKVSAEERASLARIDTHDIEIDAPWEPLLNVKGKTYDGTSAGGPEPLVNRLTLTPNSTLRMGYAFDSAEPGSGRRARPRVDFSGWLGNVRMMRDPVVLSIQKNAAATIHAPKEAAERRRIDLPVLDRTFIGDVAVGDPVDKTLTITQRDDYAVLDWKSFNVAEGHAVKFVQKDSQALAVNRINDSEGSRIHGRIDANGRVFLFNPEGVLFGRTAEVNVGGLVAAGFALSDEQAPYSQEAWALSSQSTTTRVVNEGEITVRGGAATLASPAGLRQDGVINMVGGTASLVRAGAFELTREGGAIEPSVFATTEYSTAHRGRTRAIEGGGVRLWDWTSNALQMPPELLLLSGSMEVVGQGALQIIAKEVARIEGQLRPGRQIDLQGRWTVSSGAGMSLVAGRQVASWLDAGSQVRIEHTGVNSGITDDINADGTEDSSLSIYNRVGGLRLHADIRLRRGSVTLRSTAGRIKMDEGTAIATPRGETRLMAGEPLTLSDVRAESLAIEAPLTLNFRAKDKGRDGTRVAEAEEVDFGGIQIHDGSNLSLHKRYRFDSAEAGEERVVSPHFAIKGFNGDAEAPLTVTVDPASITTARIVPSPLPVMGESSGGAGEYAIESSADTTTITQTTPYLWLDWLSFDIAKDYSVVFKQERPDWLAVNRVTSETPSVIEGSLRADGRVYLLNPNGITFGATAKVDVGGLVAAAMTAASDDALMRVPTTLDLSGGSAEVANHGEIKIAKGGVATLAAPGVVTQAGQVTAPEGAIHFASTERMTIDGQGRIAQVDGRRLKVSHDGTTSANDGEVAIYGGVLDVISGVVEAKGRGRIALWGADAGWTLNGEIRPGASLLLSQVADQVGEAARPSSVSHVGLSQWLNGGTDVEIRRSGEGPILTNVPIKAAPDAPGRLILSTSGNLFLGRIEVPRLELRKPVRINFDAKNKTFDGSTRGEVEGVQTGGIYLRDGGNLRLTRTFDFDSPDPGERLVSAKVFLTGYHGDEKQELQVIHDDSPEGLQRRTATIFPRVDPVPMPDPDGKPGPEPIPEPQPRPTPEPEPEPEPVVPTPVPEPVVPAVRPAPQPEPVKPTPPPEPVVPAVEPGPQTEPVLPAAKRASRAVDPGCIVDRDERQPPGRRCEERRSDGPPDRAAAVLSRGIRLNEGSPSSPKHAP